MKVRHSHYKVILGHDVEENRCIEFLNKNFSSKTINSNGSAAATPSRKTGHLCRGANEDVHSLQEEGSWHPSFPTMV